MQWEKVCQTEEESGMLMSSSSVKHSYVWEGGEKRNVWGQAKGVSVAEKLGS